LRLNERRKRDYKARKTISKAKDSPPGSEIPPGHDDEARSEQVPSCLPRRRASHASAIPSRKRRCADLGRGDVACSEKLLRHEPAQIIPTIAREFVIRLSQ
jgi:hypothetical protein